uniref:Uncharacterized protein n=1 Tax=Octopus bimaculoides TaxID=37653 RepID=A0A0L8FTR3_OCTBM
MLGSDGGILCMHTSASLTSTSLSSLYLLLCTSPLPHPTSLSLHHIFPPQHVLFYYSDDESRTHHRHFCTAGHHSLSTKPIPIELQLLQSTIPTPLNHQLFSPRLPQTTFTTISSHACMRHTEFIETDFLVRCPCLQAR